MSHKRRLEKLEEQFKPGSWRCDVCHQWSEYRVEHSPEYAALNGPASDDPPAECSNCGFRPQTILIRYADEWRAS